MQDDRSRELSECLQWFARTCFEAHVQSGQLQISVRIPEGLSNLFDIRIRADHQETLTAIDTAARFYAAEIDPQIGINFC